LPAKTRVYGHILTILWIGGSGAAGNPAAAAPELDCNHPAEARAFIAKLQLAEIEGAEDIHRAAMWEAFGRCPAGDAGGPCRREEQRRFESQWEDQRRAIEAKYRQVLGAFEQQCRTLISLIEQWVRAAS
jgi:hypothetical protein